MFYPFDVIVLLHYVTDYSVGKKSNQAMLDLTESSIVKSQCFLPKEAATGRLLFGLIRLKSTFAQFGNVQTIDNTEEILLFDGMTR